jgi:hypothetical protein
MSFVSWAAACLSNGLSAHTRRTIYFLGLAAMMGGVVRANDQDQKATGTTIDSWQKFHRLWARERQVMRRGSARRAVTVFISLFRRDPGTTARKFGSFRRRSDLQYRGILGCNLWRTARLMEF